MRIEINDYIIVDSEICHGKPVFKNTRIMVWEMLEMLKAGANSKEIIEAYPSLTKEHIKSAIDFSRNISKKNFKLAPV